MAHWTLTHEKPCYKLFYSTRQQLALLRSLPFRLAAQKSRPRAPSVPMRSAPAYFLCKWGV